MGLVSFDDSGIGHKLLDEIRQKAAKLGPVAIMEVCGTHTMAIGKMGLRGLLPDSLRLISGPGCPVCVTPGESIDGAAHCAIKNKVTIVTFGDMVRVPGNRYSLEEVQAMTGAVEVVTSPLQAFSLAKAYPKKKYLFVAVGFETTVPAVALTVRRASENKLKNLSFLVAHRTIIAALLALINDPEIRVDGFLLPGHVSAIIGSKPYERVFRNKMPAVIAGFEPLDILSGINTVLSMLMMEKKGVMNKYSRVVQKNGNPKAMELIESVFDPVDALWRGIGMISQSGLALKQAFSLYDASLVYNLKSGSTQMPAGCQCGDVLRGKLRPDECILFGKGCTPMHPVGPCMVSSEGSCAAVYKYGG
ncbi:MAG: hydrogenase formation protein HypD [Chitinivibrionales bacterium]|nr:hydrogenase formation protein HypD [Chitinivibrionales bacterium]